MGYYSVNFGLTHEGGNHEKSGRIAAHVAGYDLWEDGPFTRWIAWGWRLICRLSAHSVAGAENISESGQCCFVIFCC